MSTITTARTTTNEFKSSLNLQTKKPTAKSVASSLPGAASQISEARYWAESFGLGSRQGALKQYAHSRQVILQAASAAVVHDLVFGVSDRSVVPLAVASGPRVRLYGTTPQSSFQKSLSKHSREASNLEIECDRQVPTGGHLALAVAFRQDGQLLAVATDHGQIRIANATSRATLVTFQARLAIRAIRWFRDGQHLLSAGDDAILRIWQLASQTSGQQAVLELPGHGDAIRCAKLWQASSLKSTNHTYKTLGFTGSYDHTVRIWNLDDLETDDVENRCLAVLSHGAPVEALLVMPSSDATIPCWLISAGGTHIKVWNPLSGTCVCTIPAQHRKTISSLLSIPRIRNNQAMEMRIVTAGLDGLLRIHAWNSETGVLEHLHGIKLSVAITSLAVNESGDRLAIGTVDGSVLVRQKGPSITQHKRKREPKAGTYAFFTRGMNADAVAGDYIVEAAGKKRKLRKFDLALKQFRYGDALDEALETRIPQIVVAVLEELGKRRGLSIALSNRDEESLEPILSFTVRYISRPRFSALLIGVANMLIDIYGDVAGQSEVIDELFAKLKNQVTAECRAQKMLLRVVGQLDAIMTAVEMDEEDSF